MQNEIIKSDTLPEPIKKGQEQIIVNQIQVRSADRSRKDIGDWKNALITAESVYNPNRTRLLDIYADVLLDGHLSGIITKRIETVVNKNLVFSDKKGSRVEALDELIHSRGFYELLKTMMETIFFGISGFEFIPGKTFECKQIPRKHIKPKWGIIAYEQNGQEGVSYLDAPNLLVVGEADDLGLLLKCAPYALLKRGNLADWGQFIEIFGQPIRVIKYDAYDKQAKVELKEVLDEAGSSLALLIPKTAEFELMDGKSSNANGDLQNKFKDALNDEMSICVLGNTETTGNSNGGSNAKSQTQQKEQLEISKSDMRWLLGWLNSAAFLDILKSYGYPVEGGKFSFEKEIDIDQVVKQVTVALSMKENGTPIGDDYLYEITGIPKPDDYDAQKIKQDNEAQKVATEKATAGAVDTKNKKKPDPEDLTDKFWNKLRLNLADFFDPAQP